MIMILLKLIKINIVYLEFYITLKIKNPKLVIKTLC